jgi:hypothetical protein
MPQSIKSQLNIFPWITIRLFLLAKHHRQKDKNFYKCADNFITIPTSVPDPSVITKSYRSKTEEGRINNGVY